MLQLIFNFINCKLQCTTIFTQLLNTLAKAQFHDTKIYY